MNYLTKQFWDFPHDSKLDVLQDPQHLHVMLKALNDEETDIQYNHDGTYTLYGRQEALLAVPKLLSTRLLLCFYMVAHRLVN